MSEEKEDKRKKEAKWLSDEATLKTGKNYLFIEESDNKEKACLMLNINLESYLRYKKEKHPTEKVFKIFNNKGRGEIFQDLQPIFYDKNGLFWLWNFKNYCWEITDEVDLLNMVEEATGKDVISPKNRTEIINTLKQEGRKRIPEESCKTWVQFKNKIINIKTNEIFEATPEYFITNPINWDLGLSENTPNIDILFESWVNKEHKQELYEILAFCIVPDYFIHRLFCLIGSGANGKSTFLNLLINFIGEENITSSSLHLLMTQRFEGSKLLKKLTCLMGETNFTLITNTDYIKKLTGQDLIRAEFKGKNCFDFRNYAKLLIATNSLPPTADKTEGFYRRWKIIEFPNKFEKEFDVLSTIPKEEYNNLALKCLNITKQLLIERKFSEEGSFEERKKAYEDKSNPLMSFIKENYEKDVNSEVLYSDFYDNLINYLEERGFRTLSAKAVTNQLRNEGFESKTLSKNNINGRFILGIKAKNNDINDINYISTRHTYEEKCTMVNIVNNLNNQPFEAYEKPIPEEQEVTQLKLLSDYELLTKTGDIKELKAGDLIIFDDYDLEYLQHLIGENILCTI
jgi:P4 family phage/plasmid primase-like protien